MNTIYKLLPIAGLLICIQILFSYSFTPPTYSSNSTNNAQQFNGQNAFEILNQLMPNDEPHPTGSVANKKVRDRIMALLKKFNLEPFIQTRKQCSLFSSRCVTIENIIATRKGTSSGDALMLVVHYDSKKRAPGAGDDMAAVATLLENVHQLAQATPTKNDIIFLFTDGEELGMIGATAFAKHHALMKTVGLVANFEARGSSGPSLLFETGATSGDAIAHFIKFSKAPSGSSLFSEIYDRMSNNTDFTIFKDMGVNGLNFAFTGSPRHYHTALDNIENLNKNSLQHQGQNQLDVIRAFGDQDLSQYSSTSKQAVDRVFFDVFSVIYFDWSITTSWIIIGIIILVFIYLLVVSYKNKQVSIGKIIASVPVALLSIIALVASAYLLTWPLAIWSGLNGLDHAAPYASRLSLLLCTIFIAVLTARIFSRWFNSKEMEFGFWLIVFALLLFMQINAAGTVYFLLVPILIFALTRLLLTLNQGQFTHYTCNTILLAVCAYFGVSLAQLIETAVNFDIAFVLIIPMFLMLSPLVTMLANSSQIIQNHALILSIISLAVILPIAAFINPASFG
ncbi:MAG: M20/M25/M40 family metallo-hydrolase [Hyphomicrobiales bacterium]